MKKYTITIFDNETKDVERIYGDLIIASVANIKGDELECVSFIDQSSTLEQIMRLHIASGRHIQNVRIADRYANSINNVGDTISTNTFKED